MNWRGWAAIGAILMMVAGAFKIISGIYGLFNNEWIVLGYNGYFLVDVTGLAVWILVVGVLLLLGGIAVVQGSRLGRIVAIVAASLAILSELFMLPVHPVWSIVLLVLYVLALIGFIMVKRPVETTEAMEASAAEEQPAAPAVEELPATVPAPDEASAPATE